MSIHVEGISKRFGQAVALDDVTLEVPTGSLTALLGPSGGGKSTLLRIIAGLDAPDRGSVRIEGEDLTATPARHRGVGFCFQHYAPFRHLTVRRNVAFGLEIRRRPKTEIARRVDELLELVGLSHLGDRYPAQL
ncbi:MAG TPA: ATP-binding cassette domain-containing protein, partial [Acidimicrobiales bacterium]|nr:ATP-binding cassette domain-containing protein [Acidimicrobiales bacterium]